MQPFTSATQMALNMKNFELVGKFKARLINGGNFYLLQENEFQFSLTSNECRILFVFDRYQEGAPIIFVAKAGSKGEGLHVLLLRHLRGALDQLSDHASPENFAEIFNRYFVDLLTGDFSIESEYLKREDDFFTLLMYVPRLDEDDPIKIKVKLFDISWIADLKIRLGM